MVRPKATTITISFLAAAFAVLASSCNDFSSSKSYEGADMREFDTNKSLKTQTMSLTWKNKTYVRDFLCTQTIFPASSRGGGDPFSGATRAKHTRPEVTGFSPTPQWLTLETDDDRFLVRLACDDQWVGHTHITSNVPSDGEQTLPPYKAVEVFISESTQSAPALKRVYDPDIRIDTLKSIQNIDKAMQSARDQIGALKPFAAYLRTFHVEGLANPVFYKVSGDLPKKQSRMFPSEPFFVACDEGLDSTKISQGSAYASLGQSFLDITPGLKTCKFIRHFDRTSAQDIQSKSPYLESSLKGLAKTVQHIVTVTGDAVFVPVASFELRDPRVMMHNPGGKGARFQRVDPFLETDFYNAELEPALAVFSAYKSDETGD